MADTSRRRPSDVHKDVACYLLRTSQGDAQCVIARVVSTEEIQSHVLITNHHVLPTNESIRGCSLVIGSKILELKVGFPLYSCCGPNSAWAGTSPNSSIHAPLPGREAAGRCPREEDWTAVILDNDFVSKLVNVTFPILRLRERDGTSTDISIFERLKDGEIKLHNFKLNGARENGGVGLKRDISDYVSRSRLRYPCIPLSDIGPGCSGAPIFTIGVDNSLSLVGIHCSSPGANTVSDANHVGLSTDFILSSLYCGGLDVGCSLVPTLSALGDMVWKLKTVPSDVVLNQVSRSIDCQKKHHQCEELTKLEHEATQFKAERHKYFLYNIEILEFVLSEMHMNSPEVFKLATSQDRLQPTMKLLTALFSMFGASETSEINTVFGSKKDGGGALEDHIKCVCQELLQLLKSEDNRQSSILIKAASELLSALLNFSYNQGPACCFLETPNVRILGNIAQSDAAKSDVGTMQACYTAYLKSLELAHQRDMARMRLEGENKFEAAEKKNVLLTEMLTQHADREKALMSQRDEKTQKCDELETMCSQHLLALKQLQDIRDELDEENEEQARKLIECNQKIKELQLLLESSAQHSPPHPRSCSDPQSMAAVTQDTSVLQKRATDIAQYMNPTEIIPHLFEKQLLTQGQLSHLDSLHETKAKNMYIVQKVSSQGHKGVSSFIECLRATANEVPVHGDLANALL